MNLHVIDTGFFKLDGGAMFGVVPKTIWQKLNPPDENNLCTWAMRCLLVQIESRTILIDTGMGNKQSEKFFSYYEPSGEHTLNSSLASKGIGTDQITDVVLTHLHFDHVGGAVTKTLEGELLPTFPNARYYVSQKQLETALNPNEREKASFLKENIEPLLEKNVLDYIKKGATLAEKISFLSVNGHTESQLLPLINTGKRKILFAADLIPSLGHIPIPYVMGYDMKPLETLKEKKEILSRALEENWILFFEHDPIHEACTLKMTDRGIRADKVGSLADLLT